MDAATELPMHAPVPGGCHLFIITKSPFTVVIYHLQLMIVELLLVCAPINTPKHKTDQKRGANKMPLLSLIWTSVRMLFTTVTIEADRSVLVYMEYPFCDPAPFICPLFPSSISPSCGLHTSHSENKHHTWVQHHVTPTSLLFSVCNHCEETWHCVAWKALWPSLVFFLSTQHVLGGRMKKEDNSEGTDKT